MRDGAVRSEEDSCVACACQGARPCAIKRAVCGFKTSMRAHTAVSAKTHSLLGSPLAGHTANRISTRSIDTRAFSFFPASPAKRKLHFFFFWKGLLNPG